MAMGNLDQDIIENPENWEEMKKKFKEREEEQVSKLLAKRKVATLDELKDVAFKAIGKRSLRTEHTALKDSKILTEARSIDVVEMKKKIEKETFELAQEVLQKLPSLVPSLEKKVSGSLKGRIKRSRDPESQEPPSSE